jgi:hypothetical protein
MVAGAALTAWSAAIHLDLWLGGYRGIHVIGALFLAQAVTGFVLTGLILVTRHLLAALAGTGFLLATMAGLAYSVWFGLFGFHDSLDAPFAATSLAVESAGAVMLGTAALLRLFGSRSHRRSLRSLTSAFGDVGPGTP